MAEKCVLAYSGGLDTSVAIRWIAEKYNVDVIAVAVDVGEEKDYEGIKAAMQNIEKIAPRKLVLISTVDVYGSPRGADELTPIETEQFLQAFEPQQGHTQRRKHPPPGELRERAHLQQLQRDQERARPHEVHEVPKRGPRVIDGNPAPAPGPAPATERPADSSRRHAWGG